MSDYISEEVLIEILKRLPVKSLVRYRCVSKSWYSLITSPNFISLHIAHSIETKKTYPLLKLRSLTDYNDKLSLCNDDDSFTPIHQLGLPIKNPEKRTGSTQFEIVGSCNGLICLCDLWFKGLHLWNPALGEFVTIFTPTRTGRCITVTGFGFDSKKNDYKVVKVEYQPEIILPLIQIYELSSNSWRTISVTNLTCVVSHLGSPTYVNGVVHWFGRKMGVTGKTLRITSFDFGDEAFGELMLPDALSYWPPSRFHLALSVCGQLLTLIQYGAHSFDLDSLCRGFNMSCCIWMMKEYGVTQSWTKQYTVNLENHRGFLSILSFRGNGEFLLEKRRDELASYDPKTKRMTSLGARGLSKYYKVYSYMLSLVSLKGLNEMLVEGDDVEKTKKLKTSIEE